jgi:glutamate--cysteine ligase
MTAGADSDVLSVIADRDTAEGYIAKVCFKTGPPTRVGIELEWTVHHGADPMRPLEIDTLAAALGPHAPPTLVPESPHQPLARGGVVTVEPGGQVELSTPPLTSLTRLIDDTTADYAQLEALLGSAGLQVGGRGCDPRRGAHRLITSERYQAMERAFDRIGPDGRVMMCATAGLQVNLDIGAAGRAVPRWLALHALGPPLIALFANSPGPGWASYRMGVWYRTDPVRTLPPRAGADPIGAWAWRVLDTPLSCLRRPGGCWDAPPGVTFADWIGGALPWPPTFDDLSYHLTTMFPPVRPRGHYEIRYLDAQPAEGWMAPVAMLTALFSREETVDVAAEIAAPAADRWMEAARLGLADPIIAAVVPRLTDLACRALSDTDLPAPVIAAVAEQLSTYDRRSRCGVRP